MTEPTESPRDLPELDPEQFVGGTPAGERDPVDFSSNDQSEDEPGAQSGDEPGDQSGDEPGDQADHEQTGRDDVRSDRSTDTEDDQ